MLSSQLDRSVSLRRHMVQLGMGIFAGWGYREVQTSLLHFLDALKPGLDEQQIERCLRVMDREGNLVVLRPDMTPVIAKHYTAQLANKPLPLRLCYANRVVRRERAFSQERLETYQIGIEHIGGPEPWADIEVILVAMEFLDQLGLEDVQISLADHTLVDHLLASSGAPSRIRKAVRAAIQARDRDEVRAILTKIGCRDHYIEAISTLADLRGGPSQLDALELIIDRDDLVSARLERLRFINTIFNALGYRQRLRLQLGELGGASYYSGVAFSIVCVGASREIGRGGRYDDLIGRYGPSTPAVGFTLYADAVLDVLIPQQSVPPPKSQREQQVRVDIDAPLEGLRRALERRAQGQIAQLVVDPESGGGER